MRTVLLSKAAMFVVVCSTLAMGSLAFATLEEDKKAPKHTIKEVMKIAHKDGLLKKVLGGDGTDEEKKALLDAYVSLVENTPTKGDIESWHQLAGKAALAAAKVVVGRDDSLKELETATNCKACHDIHK